MSYKLRIIFDGAVAVGPPYPRGGYPTKEGPLFAVMPAGLRQQTRYYNSTKPTYTGVHFPVIIAGQSAHGRPEDDYYKKTTTYLWYPIRERLELSFDGIATAGELSYKRADPLSYDCSHKDPNERIPGAPLDDIAAVSDMREIWPARSRIRKEMLDRQPPQAVTAQVFVPRGEVSGGTDDPVAQYGVPVCYRPKRTVKEVEKCALQQVIVTVEVEKSFEIAMYSLDTGLELEGLSFDISADTDILIGNGDPKGIRERLESDRTFQPGLFGPCEQPAIDFELFYNILEGPDDGGGLPIPYYPRQFLVRPCYTTLVNEE